MTTFVATRADPKRPSDALGWSQATQTAWGTIEVSANPAPADVYRMCKLPKGAVIIGGRLLGDRISSGTSAGSTSIGLNVGIDGTVKTPTGTSIGTTTTSNCLGAFTTIDYAAVAGVRAESGMWMPLGGLLLTDGPLLVTGGAGSAEETFATVTGVTSATSFITGTLTLEVDYYMGQHH